MSKIVYIKGDVLESDERVIVHGCNCFNTMGSGIARQIREKYPEAWQADQDTEKGDRSKMASYSWADCSDGKRIVNAYTQYYYGRDSNVIYLDYNALTTAIIRVATQMCNPGEPLAMPKIGCGLANGDWDIVSGNLERISKTWNRTFHVYEL